MKTRLIFGLFVILILLSFSIHAADISGIPKAVPVNIKASCEPMFVGEPFCKYDYNAVYQKYQNDVCVKYDKIIKSCKSGEMCENGKCVTGSQKVPSDIGNILVTGNVIVTEANSETNTIEPQEGFFAKIINWFKNLF